MRYKAVVAYNGANYVGWQTQQHGDSVQEKIEQVLMIMNKKQVDIVASGRTDAKVHALGQVFHFDSDLDIPISSLQAGMNSLLPKDIIIQSIEIVDDEFHARFHAVSKRYDYYVSYELNNPFINDFMAIEKYSMDIDKMKEASKYLLGEHDFTSFTSSKIDPRKSRVKNITRIDILEEDNKIHFIFEGNGFLRYMVRMLVQTLMEVGKGNIQVEDVKTMLDSKDKHVCRFKAPPQGLYLVSVNYKED